MTDGIQSVYFKVHVGYICMARLHVDGGLHKTRLHMAGLHVDVAQYKVYLVRTCL